MAIYVGYDLFVSDYLVQNGEIGDNFNLGEAPRQLKREIDLLNGVLPDIWISGNTYLYTDMVTYEGIVYRANVNTSSTTLPSVSSEWDDVTYTSVDGLEEFYLKRPKVFFGRFCACPWFRKRNDRSLIC